MDHREIIQEGRLHRLVINKTTARDAGIYKCTVKNQTTESKVTVKGIELDRLHMINSIIHYVIHVIISLCLELLMNILEFLQVSAGIQLSISVLELAV